MCASKIINKVVIIFLTLIVIFSVFCLPVCATSGGEKEGSSIGDILQGADDFVSEGLKNGQNEKISSENLKNLSDQIYNILLVIGIIIAFIIGMILAMQFMTGSIEAKSKVKESLIPYIAGCVVIFGAFGIWKLVVIILRNI